LFLPTHIYQLCHKSSSQHAHAHPRALSIDYRRLTERRVGRSKEPSTAEGVAMATLPCQPPPRTHTFSAATGRSTGSIGGEHSAACSAAPTVGPAAAPQQPRHTIVRISHCCTTGSPTQHLFPTAAPIAAPTASPSAAPSAAPTAGPTGFPTAAHTNFLVDCNTNRWKKRGSVHPPAGTIYTAVSAGTFASYFLRSDGAVDRTMGKGVVCDTMSPPPGVTYTAVAAGTRQT
jgi:hypothetical protein